MKALVFASALLLAGCSSLSFKDNVSDVSATTAAVTCSLVNPVVGIVCGAGTGVLVNTLLPAEEGVKLEQVQNEHQRKVAETEIKADLIKTLGWELLLGGGAIFLLWTILTWWLGARRKRPEEVRLETERDFLQRMVEK